MVKSSTTLLPFQPTAYLSLGSNLGQRKEQLQQAVELLRCHPAIEIMQCSSVYETKPWGPVEQAPFWNLCLKLNIDEHKLFMAENIADCAIQGYAQLLLEYCLYCEQQLGRERGVDSLRWGPRSIDIDIIDYERLQFCSETLVLPHPQFSQRLFVLVPLAEIADREFIGIYSLQQSIQRLKMNNPNWGHKIGELIVL